ncbi:hypothetical protein K449DRAFT_430066 [Hypoxylon sp. EC38]|nr:hypothetical protein K449DRAFT_430066 [Hypoxylon sp. EC38]
MSDYDPAFPYKLPSEAGYFPTRRPSPPTKFPALPLRPSPTPTPPSPSNPSLHLPSDQNPNVDQGKDSKANGDGKRISEEARIILCPKCGFSASQHSDITEHEQYTHVGTVCRFPGCYRITGTEAELRNHLVEYHIKSQDNTQTSQLKCGWPGCEKTYTTSQDVHRCCFQHCSQITMKVIGSSGVMHKRLPNGNLGYFNYFDNRKIPGSDLRGRGSHMQSHFTQPVHPIPQPVHPILPPVHPTPQPVRPIPQPILYPIPESARLDGDRKYGYMPQMGDNAKVMEAISALAQKVDGFHQSHTAHILEVGHTLEKFSHRLRDLEQVVNRLDQSHRDLKNTTIGRNNEIVRKQSLQAPVLPDPTPASPFSKPQDKRPVDSDSSPLPPRKQRKTDE